jgi:hypothetical protein
MCVVHEIVPRSAARRSNTNLSLSLSCFTKTFRTVRKWNNIEVWRDSHGCEVWGSDSSDEEDSSFMGRYTVWTDNYRRFEGA